MSTQRAALKRIETWFATRNQAPFAFQRRAWKAFLAGSHGIIQSSTGSGKTLAVFLGPVLEHFVELASLKSENAASSSKQRGENSDQSAPATVRRKRRLSSSLRVLWITPLRALAADTEENLVQVGRELGLDWHIEKRTSDTSSSVRQKQMQAFPEVLITTPESCCTMLSQPNAAERFASLQLIVVDELHELIGTKRGVQVELALARMRRLQPKVRLWALSATLGDTETAKSVLIGCESADETSLNRADCHELEKADPPGEQASKCKSANFAWIQGDSRVRLELLPLLPEKADSFPWSGHIGTRLVKQVADCIRPTESCLVFTNTRSQTEIWYRALLTQLPELAGRMATHHGSLDQSLRWWVEDNLRSGKLKCCVCTSSLDLGVDFTKVDHVIQVGSPKSIARLLQRAGRSGHAPGRSSRLTFVPTNAMEVLEFVGLQDGIRERRIESRSPLKAPLDVLIQHCVTLACGDGFQPNELLDEVRSTAAYRDLSDQDWGWVLDFIAHGGSSLSAYPDFHRVQLVAGRYQVADARLAKLHRMSIGTIVSDASMLVRYMNGASIGTVEESFIAKMKVGDTFMLAGKILKLIRVHQNTAYVRKSKSGVSAVPRWLGGRLPLSGELSQAVRCRLDQASHGKLATPELRWMKPIFQMQEQLSAIPAEDELLIETWKNRDGMHLFVYPWEGRLVHEGLAALVALRISRWMPVTFSITMNDYGFLLLAKGFSGWNTAFFDKLFSLENLEEDILSTLNATEMAKRQFREVARVAGLIFQGFPGQRKQAGQVQASSNMFYDVFEKYDPDNLLLRQTRAEVLGFQLQIDRMRSALQRILASRPLVRDLVRPSPFGFGLIVDRLRERVSSEAIEDRVQRMLADFEAKKQAKVSGRK